MAQTRETSLERLSFGQKVSTLKSRVGPKSVHFKGVVAPRVFEYATLDAPLM